MDRRGEGNKTLLGGVGILMITAVFLQDRFLFTGIIYEQNPYSPEERKRIFIHWIWKY